jgi:hypothetical protein
MADPDGEAARYWSPEVRAAAHAFGYTLSDEDMQLRQEAEAVQAAAAFESLANAPPLKKKKKLVKKKRKHKSRPAPTDVVQESATQVQPQLGPDTTPTFHHVVQEGQPPRKRPSCTITSDESPGDAKHAKLSPEDQSPEGRSQVSVQEAIRTLLTAMQNQQSTQAVLEPSYKLPSPVSSYVSVTASERPQASVPHDMPRRSTSETYRPPAISDISSVPFRPAHVRDRSPLPSSLGRGSGFTDLPSMDKVRTTPLNIPPFKRKLPYDGYIPPQDPRRGANMAPMDLSAPQGTSPASGLPRGTLDTSKPPPFKIPRKPATSAAAGTLGDLLATMLKSSGFTIPLDPPPGLPQHGPPVYPTMQLDVKERERPREVEKPMARAKISAPQGSRFSHRFFLRV